MDDERAGTSPDDALRAQVSAAMAGIVAGEEDAIWVLHGLAAPTVARMVRAEARRIDVWLDDDEVFGLTVDAALELSDLAGSWRPDGALPWVWARRRILALVHEEIGVFTRPLDDTHLDLEEPPRPAPIDDPRRALRHLAHRHPAAHRLDRCLDAVATPRDAQVWLGVQVEKAAGNRSPAVTVGADHDLRPDAVRKVVQRVGQRLGEVA